MVTGPEIAQRAEEQLVQLTKLQPATVASLAKDQDGWHVTVVLVEMKRIPEANDVLATYETLLDDEGNLLSYRRTRRYYRGQIGDEES